MATRRDFPASAALPGAVRQRLAGVRKSVRKHVSQIVLRISGLPITLRAMLSSSTKPWRAVRGAYADRFWRPGSSAEWAELIAAILLWPFALIGLSIWYVARNGSIVARRSHRAVHRQFLDQIRLYFTAGVLPPWYYIYELFERPWKRHARSFINRCECKSGVIAILKERRPPVSIVSDKVAFAEHCRASGIPSIPILGVARAGRVSMTRRMTRAKADWFVKPIDGKGGKGIERWDRVGRGQFRGADGQMITRAALIARLADRSLSAAMFIQPRIENHPALRDLSNGALATVRALTCLDEQGRTELVGAVLRMAIGDNHVVDNMHAGGIVAGIDLATGELGMASNLGTEVELGWLDRHPTSGALIRGRRLPFWKDFARFVGTAHAAFADRVLIGWDIAMTATGLVVVEANGAPDFDIMQRPFRRGLMRDRLGQLLAFHLGNPPASPADPKGAGARREGLTATG